MNPLNQLNKTTVIYVIVVLIVCLVSLQNAPAVSPPPDGGYPGANTAEGDWALLSLTSGGYNTAVGYLALRGTTTNYYCTGVGAGALLFNTANENTAIGCLTLFRNTTGAQNTATGVSALESNTSGGTNTADGDSALYNNSTASNNSAVGYKALFSNTTGTHNTAWGDNALLNNMTGGFNIAVGSSAGANLTTGSNNIEIGHPGFAGEHDTIRIGNVNHIGTFIDGIYAVNEGTPALAVYVSSTGQLGTQPPPSSRRFKKEIKPMDTASEAILALKPVTFQYKSDTKGTPQFGLIAEEVAEVNPALVLPDKEGKPYTVRYDAVNAMLLNEFLKEHKTVQDQGATITALRANDAKQEATIAQQQKQIDALTAGLQKVSAELELNKPAPQTVLNDQ